MKFGQMRFRVLLVIFCLVIAAPVLCAQSGEPPRPEEQNETMLDTLKRMQIKREEQEHKKIGRASCRERV